MSDVTSPEAVELPEPTTTTPTTSAPKTGDRERPIPVGSEATFSNGWKLKIVGSSPSAWPAIKATNQFNDPPAPGHQFFMVKVTATYTGQGSESALGGLSFSALDSGNTEIDEDCGVIPDELDSFKEVFSGGSLTGNVCFPVQTATASSLVMYVDAGMFNGERAFFGPLAPHCLTVRILGRLPVLGCTLLLGACGTADNPNVEAKPGSSMLTLPTVPTTAESTPPPQSTPTTTATTLPDHPTHGAEFAGITTCGSCWAGP